MARIESKFSWSTVLGEQMGTENMCGTLYLIFCTTAHFKFSLKILNFRARVPPHTKSQLLVYLNLGRLLKYFYVQRKMWFENLFLNAWFLPYF